MVEGILVTEIRLRMIQTTNCPRRKSVTSLKVGKPQLRTEALVSFDPRKHYTQSKGSVRNNKSETI